MMIRSMLISHNNPETGTLITNIKPRKNKKIVFNSPERLSQLPEDTSRPRTTPVIRKHQLYSTLNSTRNSHLVDRRSIDAAEEELSNRFKSDMNSYLRKKFRTLIMKREEDMMSDRLLNSTIEMAQMENTSKLSANGTFDQFFSLVNHESAKVHMEKGVQESYLLTAKERISRLVEMKKQAENKYMQIHRTIETRQKIRKNMQIKQTLAMPKQEHIQQEKWDQEWREECKSEIQRYRRRLFHKHSKKNTPYYNLAH